MTVTVALDHAELSFALRDLPGFLRMDGFVVRSLREARLRSASETGDQGLPEPPQG